MQLPNNSLVLVADGRKSLFFRNEGDGAFPNLSIEDKAEFANPAHHEQASDTAGQSMKTMDGRGGSMEEVDFHRQEEDRFAAELAETLKSRALANEFEALIIVAPPRTLGALRKHYHKEVERRILGEVPKDLVNLPVPEIEKALQGA
ncbi:host attachment family protein [Sphingosinicella sp.]|uniref:host attachment family protein n=1 Tax=Sphingosinicella sp. TaxID=1917971 RepID=UPI004037B770